MEVKQPHILSIPTIYTPKPYITPIYEPYKVISPFPTNQLPINTAGCTYWHRDIENTGNTQLLIDPSTVTFPPTTGVINNISYNMQGGTIMVSNSQPINYQGSGNFGSVVTSGNEVEVEINQLGEIEGNSLPFAVE